MAAKAIKYKRSMALEPMNSYERHVIHTALQDYEGVSTSSTGVEPNRRVVVNYERPAERRRSRAAAIAASAAAVPRENRENRAPRAAGSRAGEEGGDRRSDPCAPSNPRTTPRR